ncbi:MAG TPA: alpha/beta fold hydrolase [Methylophilaceae bacterium]|nr:alpha/beta fold hydrolase [Methylophilaceae bacterium]
MLAPYRPPCWLRGRHLQTIYPAAWMPLPEITYRRETWETPDGDQIALDWLAADTDAAAPLVVLFHGLEGDSRSHYALRLMQGVQARRWRGVVVHFRGCGGLPNRLPRGYHCGDSNEIDWILKRLKTMNDTDLYAVGVSLGGNAMLKWLGEQGHAACAVIERAVAISAPLALPTTGHVLGSGFNKLYARLFLKTLRPKALAMIERHGLPFDREAIAGVDNLWHYDGLFTAPLHGFKDADDYWAQSNSRPHLKSIAVPTLLINARNDPFLPEKDLPQPHEIADSVSCEFPAEGGHVGFASKRRQPDWLAARVLCFLQSQPQSA